MDNPSAKGAYGEAMVVADLLKNGLTPHYPILNDSPYDILVTYKNRMIRVQVKYRLPRKDRPYKIEITTRRTSSRTGYRDNKSFDILALVYDSKIAYVPANECTNTMSFIIDNNSTSQIRRFDDHLSVQDAIDRLIKYNLNEEEKEDNTA